MPGHVGFQRGLVLALIAFVRLVFCVSSHVNLKILFLIGCIIADLALERFFAIMNPKVRLQIAFLSEALTTPRKVTYEWLFTDMGPLVDLEAPGARVALSADVADIGFRPSVYQLVRLKMPLSYKTLVAVFKLTYKWPSTSLLKQNGR